MIKYIILLFASFTLFGCVQQTYERTVNFSVDMRGIDNVQSVGVRGDFRPLNWNESFELTDTDQDSIFTGQIIFDTPFDFVSLKFVMNNEVFELDGKNNRQVYFDKEKPLNYEAVFDVE